MSHRRAQASHFDAYFFDTRKNVSFGSKDDISDFSSSEFRIYDFERIIIEEQDFANYIASFVDNVIVIAFNKVYIHHDDDVLLEQLPILFVHGKDVFLSVPREVDEAVNVEIIFKNLKITPMPFRCTSLDALHYNDYGSALSKVEETYNNIFAPDRRYFDIEAFRLHSEDFNDDKFENDDDTFVRTFTITSNCNIKGITKIRFKKTIKPTIPHATEDVLNRDKFGFSVDKILARYYYDSNKYYLDGYCHYLMNKLIPQFPIKVMERKEFVNSKIESEVLPFMNSNECDRCKVYDQFIQEILRVRKFLNRYHVKMNKCICVPSENYFIVTDNNLVLRHHKDVLVGVDRICNFLKSRSCSAFF
jgi:hypothetical protein